MSDKHRKFVSGDRRSKMKAVHVVKGSIEPKSLVPVGQLPHGKLARLCQVDFADLT